jgi:hypothetical protein
MKLISSCSKDTYITDKIVNDTYSSTSNVGKAATLDLFKLYSETEYRGTGSQHEVSRILVKFDLSGPKKMLTTKFGSLPPNFSAKIKLFDISSGHSSPSNFTVSAMPLSQAFDEGIGKDLSSFSDIGVSNFLTASVTSAGVVNLWYSSGANASGDAGANLDVIKRANLSDSNGMSNIYGTMLFKKGTEDLIIDVTRAISGTLANQISDHGFRISFDGTNDTDKKSRFVKRFASRHVSNPHLRPVLEVSFDDSLIDNHESFFFNTTGSLFISNKIGSSFSNFRSGNLSVPVQGSKCMNLKLKSGRYSKTFPVSQHSASLLGTPFAGIYSCSFALPGHINSDYNSSTTIQSKLDKDGYLDFTTYWTSLDGSVVFHTGSVRIKKGSVNQSPTDNSSLDIYSTNTKSEYSISDEDRIRVFCLDHKKQSRASKLPTGIKSVVMDKVYYRIVDADTGKVAMDFGEDDNSTRLSTDSFGMYFDFVFNSLPIKRSYTIEYLVVTAGTRQKIKDSRARFLVV